MVYTIYRGSSMSANTPEAAVASAAPSKAPARKASVKKAPAVKKTPATTASKAAPAAAPKKPKAAVGPKPVEEAKVPAPKKVKHKLVRDSFSMPHDDFKLIDLLKDRALGFMRPVKKSELLRAGLQALAGLSDAKLKVALEALAPLKPGRPRKSAE
jgi:hypothetical protein